MATIIIRIKITQTDSNSAVQKRNATVLLRKSGCLASQYAATSIENKCKIEYGTEQGLAALIYGEKGLSSLPIQDIAGEHIDTDNEYMYYYSVEFIK